MTLDEVVGSLDPANLLYEETVADLRKLAGNTSLFISRKGRDLADVVQGFCEDDRFPVVDKKLCIVAGCLSGFHEDMRAVLWRYHTSYKNPLTLEEMWLAALRYVADGHGYYISPMLPKMVLVGEKYRPDRFDKDLFLVYPIRHIA